MIFENIFCKIMSATDRNRSKLIVCIKLDLSVALEREQFLKNPMETTCKRHGFSDILSCDLLKVRIDDGRSPRKSNFF
jgi:hypothetical protein